MKGTTEGRAAEYVGKSKQVRKGEQVGSTKVQSRSTAEGQMGKIRPVMKANLKGPNGS